MIQNKERLVARISTKINLKGNVNNAIVKEYPELENLEITPSKEEQNFNGIYGSVKVHEVTSNIDPNIISENIKEGINILGVDGKFSGIDTTDATATAGDLLKDKTAYANGEQIVGTIEEYDGSFTGGGDSLKITDTSYLFYNNSRLDQIDDILTFCKDVTSTRYMFYGSIQLKTLDLSGLDTSKVTDMNYMFGNTGISNLNTSNFDTSNVTDMSHMFANTYLESIDLRHFNTSNVTTMRNMFMTSTKLVNLNLSECDFGKVKNVYRMFQNCKTLVELRGFKNLGKGYTDKSTSDSDYTLDLSACTLLTHDSLIDVINNLYDLNLTYDVANGGKLYGQQLVLGSTNTAKLTTEELAIATNKGWTVS